MHNVPVCMLMSVCMDVSMYVCNYASMHACIFMFIQAFKSQTGVVTLNYTNRFSWFRHIIRVRMMSLGIEGADEAEHRIYWQPWNRG